MFFNSIKEMNSLRKEINRLLSRGTSNIFAWKFLLRKSVVLKSLKGSSPGLFLGSSNSRRCHRILKTFIATWKWEIWEQNCEWLFHYFNFERNSEVLKSKSPCFLLKKNTNFNKTRRNGKWKIPQTFTETNLVFQLI